jgi:hypothetical protein
VSAPIPQAIQPSSPPPAPPAPSPQPVAHSPAVEHPQPVEPPHPVVPTQASPPEAPAAENEPPVGEPPVSQPTGSQPTVVAPIVTHSHSPDPEPPAEPSRVIRVESAELRGLRETCIRWLSDTYSDVEVEENGWIRLRGVSGSDIFVECSELAGNRRRLEIFAPVLFDIPLSQELLEHVAYDGAKFPLGGLSIDADPNDDLGLLQFSYRVLVDILSPYHLISVVDLVAASARREAEELQPRFGGVALAEYAIS